MAKHSEKESRPDKEHKERSDIRSPLIRRKKEEKGHDKNAIKQKEAARNQRMFGNLLDTLKEFQKQTENGNDTAQDLVNKRREIEKRLEEDDKRVYSLDYVDYRAEKAEHTGARSTRERAITQYAEEKENHLRRLQNFIKTQSKPTLFYIPAKHNDRTAQLLKESADKMEDLIKVRHDEMKRKLSGKPAVRVLDISPIRSGSLKASKEISKYGIGSGLSGAARDRLELATLGGRAGPVDRSNTSHRRVNVGAGQELSVGFDTSSGGTIGDRISRRRISMDPGYENSSSSYGSNDRRVQEVGGRRRIVVSTNNNNGDYDSARKRSHHDSEEYASINSSSYQPPLKRTLQSSVVMPTIETKSRDATITEMKKSEKTGDAVRNRRMFSNLLVGTLRQFQKEEDSTKNKTQTQFEKQREVERRLERTDKENKNKIYKEKEELINRRREKEQQILSLKRKKAIIQYAEEKQKHLRRLQHFIQTQTKPPLFFLPAKHTLRTLELLKDSAKKVENLIDLRQQEMEKELRRDEEDSDEEEDRAVGLKSAIVPVTKTKDSTEDKKSSGRYIRNPKKEALSDEGELDENGDEVEIGKVEEIGKKSPKQVETQPTVQEAEPQQEEVKKATEEEEEAAKPTEQQVAADAIAKPVEEEEPEEVDIPVGEA